MAVGLAGVGTLAVATCRRRQLETRPYDARGALIWGIVFALLVGWELAAYVQQPRADHPTLSSLADGVIDRRPVRALAFLVWIALGVELARR